MAPSHKVIAAVQAENANPLQKRLANRVQNFQIVGGEAGEGRLENLVELVPGLLRVRAVASCRPRSADVTDVDIENVVLELGPFRFVLHCPLFGVLDAEGPGHCRGCAL